MRQENRFCQTSDGVRIAWASMGQGPPLVKAANWLSHLDFDLESPVWSHWLRELSRDHTLIRYDERGVRSLRLGRRRVLRRCLGAGSRGGGRGSGAGSLRHSSESPRAAPWAIAYAAKHPERVSHLILYGTYGRGWAKRGVDPDALEEQEALMTLTRVGWGRDTPTYRQVFAELFMPDADDAQFDWFNELQRVSASPENAVKFQRAFFEIDVADLLDRVPIPPLILHARDDMRVPFEAGRALAARMPGSRFVSLPSPQPPPCSSRNPPGASSSTKCGRTSVFRRRPRNRRRRPLRLRPGKARRSPADGTSWMSNGGIRSRRSSKARSN